MAIFTQSSWQDLYSQINFKLALKTSLAALLSLYVCHELDRFIKHPDPFISGIWCVVASIFASQPTLGGTYKAIWNRFLGVLVGSVLGGFFASQWGAHPFTLGVAIFFTACICFASGLKENYRMACLSLAVIMVPWGINPTISPWVYAFFRFLDTCVGLGVAMFVAQAVWPSQALTKMQLQMADILSLVRQFYEYALVSTSSPHKSETIVGDLIKDVNQAFIQTRFNLEESKVELLIGMSPITIWVDLMSCLERLWENVRDLKKVFDSSMLEEIFDEELKKEVHHLSEQIDFILKDLVEKFKSGHSGYDYERIARLQESLIEQLVRFRATRVMKKYSLDRVENYFVFFYNFKLILNELQQLNGLIDQQLAIE